ncbi:MAG: hypothetical protein QXR53_01705 [Candidatus Norongarragalinales archaeon]
MRGVYSIELFEGKNQIGWSQTIDFESIKNNCVVESGPWKYEIIDNYNYYKNFTLATTFEPGSGYSLTVADKCTLKFSDSNSGGSKFTNKEDTLTLMSLPQTGIILERDGTLLRGDFIRISSQIPGAFTATNEVLILTTPQATTADSKETFTAGTIFQKISPQIDRYKPVGYGNASQELGGKVAVNPLYYNYNSQEQATIIIMDSNEPTAGPLKNDGILIIAIPEKTPYSGSKNPRVCNTLNCDPYWTITYDQKNRQFTAPKWDSNYNPIWSNTISDKPFGYEVRWQNQKPNQYGNPLYGAVTNNYPRVAFADNPTGYTSPRGSKAQEYTPNLVVIEYATVMKS